MILKSKNRKEYKVMLNRKGSHLQQTIIPAFEYIELQGNKMKIFSLSIGNKRSYRHFGDKKEDYIILDNKPHNALMERIGVDLEDVTNKFKW